MALLCSSTDCGCACTRSQLHLRQLSWLLLHLVSRIRSELLTVLRLGLWGAVCCCRFFASASLGASYCCRTMKALLVSAQPVIFGYICEPTSHL